MSNAVRMRARIAAVVATVVALTAGAALADPAPGTPEWYAAEVGNWVGSTGRLQDQLANPEYAALRLGQEDTTNADPYRAPEVWAPDRGRVWSVTYPNRYGATISAHVWAPRPDAARAPYPAVVMVNGYGDTEEEYWSFGEDLAEHGYVVITFDPQGFGQSDADPAPRYCDEDGSWREPQEMGVREHGDCAGHNGDAVSANAGQAPVVADVVIGGHTGQQGRTKVQGLYRELEPNFVFGAFDAHDFLVSARSPVAGLVDRRRVAVMGHSMGAYAAALTGNGDPQHRFAAAVSMDSYAHLQHHVRPRVPTMFLQSEQELFSGPRLAPPPPRSLHGTRADYPHFVDRHVPVFYAVLAASTHQEFAYLGPEQSAPASALGQRVATYYALAWLDRWLRGERSATQRLLAPSFDRSVDVSSVGLGHWDPAEQRNLPYRIAGLKVRDALSRYYRSESRFDGITCADVRTPGGCLPGR